MSLASYTNHAVALAGPGLAWASFKVSRSTHSSDQIRPLLSGDTSILDSDGQFHFITGSQSLSDVAKWWSERIFHDQNNFDGTPETLNLGILGHLSLGLQDGDDVLTLDDIGLALESAETWWLGGSSCTHVGDDHIACSATDLTGASRMVTFHADGQSIRIQGVSPAPMKSSVELRSTELDKRMDYHDNTITIRGGPDQTVLDSTFVVTDFKVTDGQDPDGKIYAGLVVPSDWDNQLHFFCGRSKEDYVADWWNDRFDRDQTTFDDTPGGLNFAVVGDLQIHIPDRTLTMTNVGLAQGRDFIANNWWFAGASCKYVGKISDDDNSQQVDCLARDNAGLIWTLTFMRGGSGNWENDVKLMSVASGAQVAPDAAKPALKNPSLTVSFGGGDDQPDGPPIRRR